MKHLAILRQPFFDMVLFMLMLMIMVLEQENELRKSHFIGLKKSLVQTEKNYKKESYDSFFMFKSNNIIDD